MPKLQMLSHKACNALIEKRVSVCELLQTGALRGEIVRGTLLLRDGTARVYALKALLKSHGCTWDNAQKAWSRASPTALERRTVTTAEVEVRACATQARQDDEARIDAVLASVAASDAVRRACCWVGMALAPLPVLTPEARAAAWARLGMEMPTVHHGGGVYGPM